MSLVQYRNEYLPIRYYKTYKYFFMKSSFLSLKLISNCPITVQKYLYLVGKPVVEVGTSVFEKNIANTCI